MASAKPTLPITKFFSQLIGSFPKLFLANVLFCLPLAVFFALFYAISLIPGLTPAAVMLIRLLTVIPVFPFYAGVTQVAAHIIREENIPVVSDFFAAVKDNFFRFLVHGTVMYAVGVLSYFSISFYVHMLSGNSALFAPLIISVIVAVFILFTFFYIPSMTVTFDISMKNIYKNSFLMSFGEFKKNLLAAFGLFLLFIFSASFLVACMGNRIAIIIVTVLLVMFFLPSVTAYIINAAVYQRMYDMVVDNTEQLKSVENRITEARQQAAVKQFDAEAVKNELSEKLREFDIDENADGDEYIFFEGRMMKRGTLLRMKREVTESEMN